MGIRKRPPGAEFPRRVDQGLCVTESFHVTFGQVDVPLGMNLRKVRGPAEGGETSTTINMFLGGGVWQCTGVGGGTASATVDIVMCQRGGDCSDDSGNGGGDVLVMAATRTGVGQRNEIGWGEEADVVAMAVAMTSRKGVVHVATKGGGRYEASLCYGGR